MKKRVLLLFTLAVICSAFGLHAITVKGTVVDTANEPLPGVSIKVLNSAIGTITDYEGAFSLTNVEPDATLQVSYVGYFTKDVKVDGRTNIDITLEEDIAKLDEVVVIGYGTAQAKDLTAPISVIKGEELTNIPTRCHNSQFRYTRCGPESPYPRYRLIRQLRASLCCRRYVLRQHQLP